MSLTDNSLIKFAASTGTLENAGMTSDDLMSMHDNMSNMEGSSIKTALSPLQINGNEIKILPATSLIPGSMSAGDKQKLDNLSALGATVLVFTANVSFGTITLGTKEITVTVNGILSTDKSVIVVPNTAMPAGLTIAHWRVSGNNTIILTVGTSILLGLTLGSTNYSMSFTVIR